jgi:YD repeat-containing protein
MTRLTTPSGGIIDYTYADHLFHMPGMALPIRSRVVTQRRTSGRDIPPGTWSYAYAQGANRNQSVFDSPCGRTTYTFLGIGFSVVMRAWEIGLLASKVTSEGATVLESEQFTWIPSETISYDPEQIGVSRDFDIRVPLVDTRTVVRGGRSSVTRNSYNAGNFNDFGRPARITETGELSRTTARTFRYGFVPYIVDKIASETVTVGAESFNKSYNYDSANGFLTSETLYGITTQYSYQYDGLGRRTRKSNPDGSAVLYQYNGIDVNITDEESRLTRQDWSAFGDPSEARLTEVTDARGVATSYAYNALGNLTRAQIAGGPARLWAYNTRNELGSETQPESGTVSYTYDAAGNLKTRNDPQFGRTEFLYDANHRRVRIDRPGAAYDTDISYDASDNRTRLANGFVGSTFVYDGANRLTSRSDALAGRSYTTGYSYDGNDNLSELRYPSGRRAVYGYDAENRILSITDGGGTTYANQFQYHPSGAPTSFRAGNGLLHSFAYDNRYRVSALNSGGVLALTYGYDRVGNVLSIADTRIGMNQSFGYDGLDRLTRADGFWGAGSLSYDNLGNRLSQSIGGLSTSYNYAAATQRLISADGAGADSFSYDANGNLIGRNGASFGFTPENMLETATVGAATTLYRYDGDNLRKQKSGKDTTQYFIHGLADRLVSEFDEPCTGTVRWVRDYVYAGTRLVATVKSPPVETRVEFVAAESSAGEAAGAAPVEVRVSTSNAAPLVCPVGVDYASSDETAVAGGDYTAAAGRLTFAAGSPSGTLQTIAVGLLDDALDEPDETFRLDLSNISGAVAGLAQHRVTIVDDDLPPELSVGDMSLVEGDFGEQSAVFNLSPSAPSGLEVRVDYSTEDIIARAPSDYTAVSGTVTFAPGATSQPVPVQVLGDTVYEADETFRLVLQNSVNATISRGAGVGTIVNDDPQPPGVPFLTTTSTNGQVKLEWTNPEVGPYASTVIRYRAVSGQSSCTFPEAPGEGELLVSQPGALGAHDYYLHRDLPHDNTTYCYAAFVELEPGLFSRARTSKGRPFDTSGAVKWAYGTGATTVEPPGLGPGIYAGSNDRILHGNHPQRRWRRLALRLEAGPARWAVTVAAAGGADGVDSRSESSRLRQLARRLRLRGQRGDRSDPLAQPGALGRGPAGGGVGDVPVFRGRLRLFAGGKPQRQRR